MAQIIDHVERLFEYDSQFWKIPHLTHNLPFNLQILLSEHTENDQNEPKLIFPHSQMVSLIAI